MSEQVIFEGKWGKALHVDGAIRITGENEILFAFELAEALSAERAAREADNELANEELETQESEIKTLRIQLEAADAQLAEVTRERDGWKKQHDMVLSQAQKDNLRAEDADRYEQWLLDLGRISGCGHVDERLPRCIEEAFAAVTAERDEAREEAAFFRREVSFQAERLMPEIHSLTEQLTAAQQRVERLERRCDSVRRDLDDLSMLVHLKNTWWGKKLQGDLQMLAAALNESEAKDD